MSLYPTCQCTAYCDTECPWVDRYGVLGNAGDWATNWASHGGSVTSSPILGSIMCLTPGTQGASRYGHVGVVVAISLPTFQIHQVDVPIGNCSVTTGTYRTGPGVSFLLQGSPPTKPAGDDEMLMIQDSTGKATYLLTGGHAVGVRDPSQLAALQAAGVKMAVLSDGQFKDILSAYGH